MAKYQRTKYPGIFIYEGKKEPMYGVDFYAGGKRYREIIGPRLKDAREELEKRRKAGRSGVYVCQTQKRKATFDELVKKYRSLKEENDYFRSTQSHYLDMLVEYFKGRKLASIGVEDIQRFRKDRKEKLTQNGKPRSGASVNRELALLRHLLNVAILHKLLERNPFTEYRDHLRRIQSKEKVFLQEPKRDRSLTPEEAKKLLAASAPYLKNIIRGLIYTGLRLGDMMRLRWENVNWETGTLTFTEKKKEDKPGEKPLTPEMLAWLEEVPRSESGLIFVGPKGEPIDNPRTAWKTAKKKAGIKDLKLRDLRRSSATALMEAGVPLSAIQKHLGHTKVTTTEAYLHVREKMERAALEKLDGHFFTGPISTGQKTVRNELSEDTPVAGTA
jgi:integrase